MTRPRKSLNVTNPPLIEGFSPLGVTVADKEPVILLFEEYEAFRLLDYEGMTQFQAAEQLDVSRPALTRIYEKARRTIAEAFVEGKAIKILTMSGNPEKPEQPKNEESDSCVCVHCNTRVPHMPGVPCRQSSCPECGKPMIRENSYHHQLIISKTGNI